MRAPTSFIEIIDLFGGPGAFEAAIGLSEGHAKVIKHRDSLAPEYWDRTVEAAAERGIPGIDHKLLAALYAKRWRRAEAAR